ncbi:hypothetical protein L208DRAFT_1399594 [Tricholoma matsutake]|nr:hypothetical protein L208DRAFT_1399594 [Tricholoma matsutake 945]
MDCFTSITQLLSIETSATHPSDAPTNEESNGGGTYAYCVVFARYEVPVNEETGGGGTGAYCVVA